MLKPPEMGITLGQVSLSITAGMDPGTLKHQRLHFLLCLAAPTGAPCPDGTPCIGHSPATKVLTCAAASAGANGTRGGACLVGKDPLWGLCGHNSSVSLAQIGGGLSLSGAVASD